MSGRFEDFKQIVERLRAPDGCPWDRVQTCESLKPCMINEMTEVIAAIDVQKMTGSSRNLCEELGDLLMNIVMMSVIAEEEGWFTTEDVISGISEKMIRRHPHVFGNASASNSGEALARWEEIKEQEKRGVDPAQRALERAQFPQAARQVTELLQKEISST